MNTTTQHPATANFRRAFSLIELLVVIAIISILMVAAIPAFTNTTNSARQTSREIIKSQLQQARAHAIASGNATAVAIPTLGSDPELGARSASLVEVENSSGNYIPLKDEKGNDRLLQRWGKLPGNFYFLTSSQTMAQQPTILDQGSSLTVTNKNQSLECHLIVFSPTGQIVRPPSGTAIHIALGQATNQNGTLILTDRTGGDPVFELLQVNRLTGRTSFVKK